MEFFPQRTCNRYCKRYDNGWSKLDYLQRDRKHNTNFACSNSGFRNGIDDKTITANTVVSASSNVVPLAGGSAGTAILPATDGAWATLVSDGTNWIIMQAN
jgi:hypothetical protein